MGGRRSDRSGAWRIGGYPPPGKLYASIRGFSHGAGCPDALNIIAADENLKQLLGKNHVLTPHMGEMSRLIAQPVTPDLGRYARMCPQFQRSFRLCARPEGCLHAGIRVGISCM